MFIEIESQRKMKDSELELWFPLSGMGILERENKKERAKEMKKGF